MKNVYSYVFDLINRLEEPCAVVRHNLIKAQAVNKMHFDKRSKLRVLKPDDLALVLLPTDENKLLMCWKGPFKIIEPIGINDYRIQIGDNINVLHINMLHKYDELTPDDIDASFAVLDNKSEAEQEGLDSDPDLLADVESWKDVMVGSDLSVEQKNEMASLISEFRVIFSDKPGKTNLVSHRILLSDDTPIRVRPYPIHFAKADVFEKEVRKMFDLGIIEFSSSPFQSPMLLINKSTKSHVLMRNQFRIRKQYLLNCVQPNTCQNWTSRKDTVKFPCMQLTKKKLHS